MTNRRLFLKQLTAAGIATTLPSFLSVDEVEKKGVRPWVWSDYAWNYLKQPEVANYSNH